MKKYLASFIVLLMLLPHFCLPVQAKGNGDVSGNNLSVSADHMQRLFDAVKYRVALSNYVPEYVTDPKEPVNMILDTDYASDVDDVAAVRVAASMHKLGMINLCAVGTSTEGDYGTRALHGHLCMEGLSNIPCGYDDECVEDEGPHWEYFSWKYHDQSSYQLLRAPDLYKKIILENAEKGRKTRIVVLGYLTNIQELIMDPKGYELTSQWVDSIWIDGGAYPEPGYDNNFFLRPEATEAIRYCIDQSPCPLVFITNETGRYLPENKCVMCGSHLSRLDPDNNDPVSKSYRLFEEWNEGANLRGGHMGWDAMTVWAAGLPRKTSMTHISRIDAFVYENGLNEFIPNPEGRHAILERDHNDIWWYSNELERLVDYGITHIY